MQLFRAVAFSNSKIRVFRSALIYLLIYIDIAQINSRCRSITDCSNVERHIFETEISVFTYHHEINFFARIFLGTIVGILNLNPN